MEAFSENKMADALVVSDLHAMSPDVDVNRFMNFVDLHSSKMLVLAGDTLEFYMWRHGRRTMDARPGIVVLDYLIELATGGVEIVILPGNHDLDWEWLASGEVVPKRYLNVRYPDGMLALMQELVAMPNVSVVKVLKLGGAMIVHGHEGWQGDWLWRVSEMGDRVTFHRFVGGQFRRKVMGGAPLGVRAAAVSLHGFYRRVAMWAKRLRINHVIHGHTHVHGRRMRSGVVLDCLPAWRSSEGPGGGMLLREEVWERVEAL